MSERLATKGAVFVPCAKCRALTRVEIEVTSETVKQEKAVVKAATKESVNKGTTAVGEGNTYPEEEKKKEPAKDVKE